MKKILFFVFLFLCIDSQAQEMESEVIVYNARLGYSGVTFPISLSADMGIIDWLIDRNDAISIGAQLNLFNWNDGVESHISYNIASRCNYHYEFIDYLDTYAGFQIGIISAGFAFGLNIGARYYFSDIFAATIEYGGSSYNGISVGISVRPNH